MAIPKACIGRKLNKPWSSNRKNKKKQVCAIDKYSKKIVNVHFGDKRYEDYTQHKDKKRKKKYLKRSAGIRDKKGRLTKDNPGSANFWSRKILWPR